MASTHMIRMVSNALKPGWWIIPLLCLLAGCADDGDIASCKKDGGCATTLEVLRVSGSLPSAAGDPFWNSAMPKKNIIELGPQLITNPQWPNPSIKRVSVGAVRNDAEIALLVEWQDDTENRSSTSGGEYTDQIAVMFPLKQGKDLPPITMGGESGVVNIWQWKAVLDKAEDLNAEGFSTLTRQEHQDVEGKGVWANKTWRVIFKRALLNPDSNDIQFKHSLPMAIAVWDGGNRETNGQKGISDWIFLRLS